MKNKQIGADWKLNGWLQSLATYFHFSIINFVRKKYINFV